MKTVNKVTLLGRVGNDPEVRFSKAGSQVVTFSIATDRKIKKQDGEYENQTQWHQCVAFGKLGEIAAEIVRKGAKVYADGEIIYKQWDSQGVTKNYTDIALKELSVISEPHGGQKAVYNPAEFNTGDDLTPF